MSFAKELVLSDEKLFMPRWLKKTFPLENKKIYKANCVVIPALTDQYQASLKLEELAFISSPIIELKNANSFSEVLLFCKRTTNPHIIFISSSGFLNPYYEEEFGLFLQWLQSLNCLSQFRLSILTLNAMQGPNNDKVINPLDAFYLGMMRTFAKENPNSHVNVFVSNQLTINTLFQLEQLMQLENKLSFIFLNENSYFELDFELIDCNLKTKPKGFKKNGTYLIISSDNKLIITLSEYLHDQYQAKLIFVTNSKVEEKIHNLTKKLNAIFKFKNFYSESKFKNLFLQYPNIDGIIHADFTCDDSSIRRMSQEKLMNVVIPSIRETINFILALDILKNNLPDFILFFSSIDSFLSPKEKGNYSSACLTKDALAYFVKDKLGIQTHIINWDHGVDDDSTMNNLSRIWMKFKQNSSISTESQIALIEACIQNKWQQVLLTKSANKILNDGEILEEAYTTNFTKNRLLPIFNDTDKRILRNKTMMDSLENYARAKIHQIKIPEKILSKFEKLMEAVEHMDHVESMSATELINHFPELNGHLKLINICMDNLPLILSGEICPLSVMFPEGSFSLVEPTYRNNPISDYFNHRIADATEVYIQRVNKDEKKTRILEVGAGTGSTSEKVLPRLVGYPVQYVYTDISVAFFKKAQQEFNEYDFIEYLPFNVESAPEIGYFDIVLASNVIHATENIYHSLKNLFNLLNDNGVLILNEMTERNDYATLTFGLTDGWWLSQDFTRIPYSPLLSISAWELVLRQVGFHECYFHGGYGQHVIEAHKLKT